MKDTVVFIFHAFYEFIIKFRGETKEECGAEVNEKITEKPSRSARKKNFKMSPPEIKTHSQWGIRSSAAVGAAMRVKIFHHHNFCASLSVETTQKSLFYL